MPGASPPVFCFLRLRGGAKFAMLAKSDTHRRICGVQSMAEIESIRQQAALGDAHAQFALAEALRTGAHGVSVSVPQAMGWYFKAASQDMTEAQWRLGVMLLDDVTRAGGKRSPQQAFQWLSRAATGGNVEAQCRAGLMLLDGDGVTKDAAAGIALLERAALENHAGAQFALGYRLCRGEDVGQDLARGMQCLLAATKQDHANAMFHLALILENGVGCDAPMPELAARMYTRALLRLNHYPAANYLGILYAKGSGVERDPQMAKELFEFAIGAGEDEPMYSLGLLLTRERSVQEFAAAAMWATLAAERNPGGNGNKLLKALEDMAGAAVVAEGRARAAAWQRTPRGLTVVSRGPDENEFGGLSFSEEPN